MIGSLALNNLRLGIFGDLVKDAMGGFGSKPTVPAAPFVDPQAAQKTTATGNLDALPTLEQVASGVDTFNLNERNKQLTSAIPGYTALTAGAGGTLGSWLRGEVPQDVQDAVATSAAGQALAGGYAGSPMAGALSARDLGLTSLNLQQAGMGALPGYLNTINNLAVPQQYDVTSGFLSPAQTIDANQWNQMNKFTADWWQNQLNARPDPATAAIAGDVGQMTDAVASMIPYFGQVYGSLGQSGSGGGMGGGAGGGGMGSIFSMLGGMGMG